MKVFYYAQDDWDNDSDLPPDDYSESGDDDGDADDEDW